MAILQKMYYSNLMSKINTISGFTPERFVDALRLMQETDSSAIVFKAMVLSIHDQLVELHDEYYMNPDIRFATGPGIIELAGLGIDVETFNAQQLENEIWPPIKMSQTNVDLVEPGKLLGWHNDVIKAGEDIPDQIYLPKGVSASMNLVGFANFVIDLEVKPIAITGDAISAEDIERLSDSAEFPYSSGLPIDPSVALLFPGDVIFWKQPANHKINVADPDRRAIVLITEDLAVVTE
jgi:hypothetical protein